MELSVFTFKWLRDVGCIATDHVRPGRGPGLLLVTPVGLAALTAGASMVRLLQHYCCHRFDLPASVSALLGATLEERRHNWGVVGRILRDALDFDLPAERQELLATEDAVEVLVLLKQIHALLAPAIAGDRDRLLQHRALDRNEHNHELAQRLAAPFVPEGGRAPHTHDRPWIGNARKPPQRGLPPIESPPRRLKPRLPKEAAPQRYRSPSPM